MQFSKIMQRVLATDLSGPKAFVESLTPRSNWTVVDVADFQFCLLSSAWLGSTLPLERSTLGTWS